MLTLCAALCVGLALLQGGTDTTVAARLNARLELDVPAGSITVRTWDRAAVRVVAEHGPGVAVRVQASDSLVRVRHQSRRVAAVDYRITVPRAMRLSLGGRDADIDVAGAEGPVSAANNTGRIRIDGGRGPVRVESILGEIEVVGVRGRVTARSLDAAIRLRDVQGEVDVESSSNNIVLEGVDAGAVRAQSVAGAIEFRGPLRPGGTYELTTHSGPISVFPTGAVDAEVSVAAVQGDFECEFPYVPRGPHRRGIVSFVLGRGAARLDVQSFGGRIRLARP